MYQFSKLTSAQKMKLRAGYESLTKAVGNTISIATGCSGTDLVIAATEDILRLWRTVFGIDATLQHLFSCESAPWKQEFIKNHFVPEVIFPDLEQLCNNSAVASDGKDYVIKIQTFWWCGIECDSISPLNSGRSENFD